MSFFDEATVVGLQEADFASLNSSIQQQQEQGRSAQDCHAEYCQLVKQKLTDKGLDAEAVIAKHKGLMYYAAVLDLEGFVRLWTDVQTAAAAAKPQAGEEEKEIWDAPAAVGEADDEEGYE